jgi:hypothetical protein
MTSLPPSWLCTITPWISLPFSGCTSHLSHLSLLQIEKQFESGTHVGFEDQVVLGDAEITSDILPWLNPLLLWLITALSALGVPFLPFVLGQVYKGRVAADAAMRLKAGMEPEEVPERPVFSRLLINPQDIALLEQQAGKKLAQRGLKGLEVSRFSWLYTAWCYQVQQVCAQQYCEDKDCTQQAYMLPRPAGHQHDAPADTAAHPTDS